MGPTGIISSPFLLPPGSCEAFRSEKGGATCVMPSLQFAEYARVSRQIVCQLLLACGQCSFQCRIACEALSPHAVLTMQAHHVWFQKDLPSLLSQQAMRLQVLQENYLKLILHHRQRAFPLR